MATESEASSNHVRVGDESIDERCRKALEALDMSPNGPSNVQAGIALCDRAFDIYTAAHGNKKADYTAVIALYDRALDICTAVERPDQDIVCYVVERKAETLRLIGGHANLTAVIALYDRVIETRMANRGAGHPSLENPLRWKTNVLRTLGRHPDINLAIASYDRDIVVASALRRIDLLSAALRGKADTLRELGGISNLNAAIPVYDRAIRVCTVKSAVVSMFRAKAETLRLIGGDANLTAAIAVYDRAVDLCGERPDMLIGLLQSKAETLRELGGTCDLNAALPVYDRAIDVCTAAPALDYRVVGDVFCGKAAVLTTPGGEPNLAVAMLLYCRLRDMYRVKYGPTHVLQASALTKQAAALLSVDGTSPHLNTAIALCDQAIAICKTGKDHGLSPFTREDTMVDAMRIQARALIRLAGEQNHRLAFALFDSAIDICAEAANRGADHIKVGNALEEKAKALAALGGGSNLLAAIASFDRAIGIYEAAHTPDNLKSASSAHCGKADALKALGGESNVHAAIVAYDRAQQINEEVARGTSSHSSWSTWVMMSKADALKSLEGQENTTAALALYDKAIGVWAAANEPSDLASQTPSDSLACESALDWEEQASALMLRGGEANIAEAIALYDRAIQGYEAKPMRPGVIGRVIQLKADALRKLGGPCRLHEAILLYSRVIDILTAARGPQHRSLSILLRFKGHALTDLGGRSNLQEAVALYDRALAITTPVYGPDHHYVTTLIRARDANLKRLSRKSSST